MNLKVSVADDAELRAFIKEQVKNALVGIAREEVANVIKDTLASATKEKTISSTIEKLAREILNNHIFSYVNAKQMARDYLSEKLDDVISSMINPDDLAKAISEQLRDVRVNISRGPRTFDRK